MQFELTTDGRIVTGNGDEVTLKALRDKVREAKAAKREAAKREREAKRTQAAAARLQKLQERKAKIDAAIAKLTPPTPRPATRPAAAKAA
jgi:hypothetical protein